MRMWASDIISECLPDSKIIFLVRDGRDIIDSQMDARKTNAWMVERGLSPLKENERNEFIKYQSERYTKLVENILETCEKHSKNKTYLIKYEDLLSNTYKELKKLYEFISVSTTDKEIKDIVEKYTFKNIPSEEKGEGKFFRAANPGKWRESFNENETKEMNSIMKNILSQLNYSIK